MLHLNVNEVKSHLSATLAKVKTGKTIIVCKRNKPIAEIRPLTNREQTPLKKRTAGYGAKKYPQFKLPDNFNAPLPAKFLSHFTEVE